MKYFTFGMKTLRITQNYNEGNHLPHWKGSTNYSDFPIDIAGADGGQDIYYATVDMKVTAIRGTKQGYTNTIWLVATENCISPIGETKPFIALTHWNDNDPYVTKLKVGDIVKEGSPICMEGSSGATANHIHFVCGDGNKGIGDNVLLNSNNKWVSNGYCYHPEKIMFINTKFTNIKDSRSVSFQTVEIDEKEENDYIKASIKVYQNHNNLDESGLIDTNTLNKMKSDGIVV